MPPEPSLRIPQSMWSELIGELHSRTEGKHESGAFLLGTIDHSGREASAIVYYDDLDPAAYDSGICILHGDAFGMLWEKCGSLGLQVVADVHVHGEGAWQSHSDRTNPMIARPGHMALILPRMARAPVKRWTIGVYEYLGDHEWRSHGGRHVSRVLKIGGGNERA